MKPMSRFSKTARLTLDFSAILLMMLSIASLSVTRMQALSSALETIFEAIVQRSAWRKETVRPPPIQMRVNPSC